MKELLMKRKKKFTMYVIASFLPVIDRLMQTAIFALIFAAIEKQDMSYFFKIIMLSGVAVLMGAVLHIISRLMRIGFMRDVLLDIRKEAFEKVINISYKNFSKQSKEVYMSHLSNDINTFENNFFLNLLNVIYMSGQFVVAFIILVCIDIKLGIAMVVVSAILALLASFFAKKTEELQLKVSKQNESFTVGISNVFNGLEILKLNNIESRFLDKSLESINKVEKRKMVLNIYTEQQRSGMMFMSYIIMISIMIYLMTGVTAGASLAAQMFTFQLANNMIFPLVEIFPRFNVVKSSISIYEKITKQEDKEESNIKEKNAFVFNKAIEVENLKFGYGQQEVLKDASFAIEKGKKYLIKGVSGSGKSTLMKLLAMTYDEYQGKISGDGMNYREIEEKSFNERVSFVYQDVFLFEDSIRNNISLYKELPEGTVEQAVRIAGLDDFIEEQENGLDTILMENGKNLSGGQRQRISIARAIAKGAEILFVDEGTSALNEKLGAQIESELLNLGCTVVAISHRYYEGITEQYDYVLEIKHGVVSSYSGQEYFEGVAV